MGVFHFRELGLAPVLPIAFIGFLPDSWEHMRFPYLPESTASWCLGLTPFAIYLVHLFLSLRVSRLRTFCALLGVLIVILFLNGIGLAEILGNWSESD
jgi:hypothetical protein